MSAGLVIVTAKVPGWNFSPRMILVLAVDSFLRVPIVPCWNFPLGLTGSSQVRQGSNEVVPALGFVCD